MRQVVDSFRPYRGEELGRGMAYVGKSHFGSSGLIARHCWWDLWWAEWHQDIFFCKYFSFPPSLSFHLFPIMIPWSITDAITIIAIIAIIAVTSSKITVIITWIHEVSLGLLTDCQCPSECVKSCRINDVSEKSKCIDCLTEKTSGLTRNFVQWGFNKFNWGQRERGSGGSSP